MDYEQKYKEALEKAQKALEVCGTDKCETARQIFSLFPELKESEDERIRKEILQSIRDNMVVIHKDKCIAWLEKQGEQKSIWHNEDEEPQRDSLILLIMQSGTPIVAKIIEPNHTFNHGERWAYIDDLLEKQGEQKTIDKSEPKFHEGDWVVSKLGNVWYIDSFDNKNYKVTDINGNHNCFPIYIQDRLHLWTIQDAKDGDVLASDNSIFIFQEEYIAEKPIAYCGLMNGRFLVDGENACWTNERYYPATKEQCNILFTKMKGAGYEWDAEKKELKKSADEPKFKVGDYVVVSTTKGDKVVQIASVEYLKGGYPSYITTEGRWFGNGTKARILTDKDMETITIPERSTIVKKIKSWSEEDETKMRAALAFIKSEFPKNGDEEFMEGTIEWLKSIKQRIGWKPSDAQIEALGVATDICSIPEKQYNELNKLYQDLKKLTE